LDGPRFRPALRFEDLEQFHDNGRSARNLMPALVSFDFERIVTAGLQPESTRAAMIAIKSWRIGFPLLDGKPTRSTKSREGTRYVLAKPASASILALLVSR
jgi:hypothetical protein